MFDFDKTDIDRPRDHVRDELMHLRARIENGDRSKIGWDEWDSMAVSLWELEFLMPVFELEVLLHLAAYGIQQCSGPPGYKPASTYNKAIIHCYTPEIIKRVAPQIGAEWIHCGSDLRGTGLGCGRGTLRRPCECENNTGHDHLLLPHQLEELRS